MNDYLDILKLFWNKLESLAYNDNITLSKSKPRLIKKVLQTTQTKPKTKYEIAKENMLKVQQQRNKNNIAIPYIPEKRIKLTNAGKLTGAEFSTNMLDSLAKYGAKANLPIELALGLAAQESTFGNAKTNGYKAQKDRGVIYGSSVISNWSHGKDNPWRDLVVASEKNAGVKNAGRSTADYSNLNQDKLDKSLSLGWKYTENLMKKFNSNINVLEHGFNLFKSGKYNTGDPNHFKDVQNSGKLAMKSPEILNWWNKEGKRYYD